VVIAVVLVAGGAAAVVLTRNDGSSVPRVGGTPPQVSAAGVAREGTTAPNFTLPRLDGRGDVALADQRGKTVVINFWASWCVPCREEFPALRQFASTHPDVVVLGVTYQDNQTDARDFAAKERATWPLLVDQKSAVAVSYGVRAIPQSFVIDANGVITHRTFGTVSAKSLDELTR